MQNIYQKENIHQDVKNRDQPIILNDKGVFGVCSCGGDVMFYSNRGVLCTKCGKLYGIWQYRRGRKKNPYRLLEQA
ncbi:MAG: hypothetical protein QXW32_00310 [Nitrososphaerales archaeon]